jgi:hypothetical protein
VQLQCQETYAVSQQPYMFKLIVMIMWLVEMSLNCSHQRIYCSSPRWYMSMENHGRIMLTGKTPALCTRALWHSYQHSYLVASRRIGQRKWWIWPCKVMLFLLAKWFFTCHKILWHGPPALLPLWRKGAVHSYRL